MRTFIIEGQRLDLHQEKAAFWREASTLIVADLHLGKAAAFRSFGIPIPEDTTTEDLRRLEALVEIFRPKRLVMLGDLLHARAGRVAPTLDALEGWCRKHSELELLLVRGNHDQRAGDPPEACNIRAVPEPFEDGPFALRHEPGVDARLYVLAGHLHPSISLVDQDGTSLRAPCFWFGRRSAVLPAFGSFTGTFRVQPAVGDRVFAVGPGEVVEINGVAREA